VCTPTYFCESCDQQQASAPFEDGYGSPSAPVIDSYGSPSSPALPTYQG